LNFKNINLGRILFPTFLIITATLAGGCFVIPGPLARILSITLALLFMIINLFWLFDSFYKLIKEKFQLQTDAILKILKALEDLSNITREIFETAVFDPELIKQFKENEKRGLTNKPNRQVGKEIEIYAQKIESLKTELKKRDDALKSRREEFIYKAIGGAGGIVLGIAIATIAGILAIMLTRRFLGL